MLPYPSVTVGPVAWEYSGRWDDFTKYPSVKVTWQFEGYNYQWFFQPPTPESPNIVMFVGNKWFPANTKEEIGKALLSE